MLNCFSLRKNQSNTRDLLMRVIKLSKRGNSFESEWFKRRWMLKVKATGETTIPRLAVWKRCLMYRGLPQTTKEDKSTSSAFRTPKSTQLRLVFPIRATKKILIWKLGNRGFKNFKASTVITKAKLLKWWKMRWAETRSQTFSVKTSQKFFKWSNNQGPSTWVSILRESSCGKLTSH